jgi:hypothetical protein
MKMSSSNYQASCQSATSAGPPSVTTEQDTRGYRDDDKGERPNVVGLMIMSMIGLSCVFCYLACVVSSIFFTFAWYLWNRSSMLHGSFITVLVLFAALTLLVGQLAVRFAKVSVAAATKPGQLNWARRLGKRSVCCSVSGTVLGLTCTCFFIWLFPFILSRMFRMFTVFFMVSVC